MAGLCTHSRRKLNWSIFSVLMTITVLEWLEYSLTPWLRWPKFPSVHPNSLRFLVVGDPQLLGNQLSCPSIFNFICIWDADRYVGKTFNLAYKYLNPEAVIFLGDNLDEGEISNDADFLTYVQRFRSIFHEVNFDKAIIIPGDNDIGGEDEPPSPEKEERFNKYFRDDVFIQFHFVEFVKINYITHSNRYLTAPNISEGAFRIVLSHIPLTPLYSSFISKALPFVQPHIILSAHEHKSMHLTADRKTGIQLQLEPSSAEFESCSFNISDSIIHEIMAPTCSYRMGTNKMGYGALVLSPTGETSYAVLWLPSRFRQLLTYVFLLGFLIFFLVPIPCWIHWNRNLFYKTSNPMVSTGKCV